MSSAELRRRLVAALAWPAAAVGGFVGAYAVAVAVLPAGLLFADSPTVPYAQPADDPEAGRVERIIERHTCWSGPTPEAMEGVVPGHAVVTLPGARARHVSSEVGFSIWVGDHDGVLHAFCP